jgi:Tfp pilus assembly protein PilF
MTETMQKYSLGQLIVELGLIKRADLDYVLSISSETSLPVGRVLIMSNYITELDLKNVLRCQTLLKEGLIHLEQGRKAMDFARNNSEELDEALYRLGWNPARVDEITHLGELLLEANFVNPQQLTQALSQCEKTGLPLGRVLVLSGVLSEALLTTAVNAQILVRDKKLDKMQASEALKQAKRRQQPLETTLKEKGFYDLPNRSCPRLGELLTAAAIISETQLSNALEMSLTNRKPIGQALIEAQVINEHTLEIALQVQRMITEGKISLVEAREVLIAIRDGRSIEDALLQFRGIPKTENKRAQLPLVVLLKMLGCVDDKAIAQAFIVAQNNSQVISQVLLIGGVLDELTLEKAERCRQMVEAGRLTVEHAGIVFDYSQRRGVDIPTALKELQWQHGDDTSHPAAQPVTAQSQFTRGEFLDLRESAAKLSAAGHHAPAREILNRLLVDSKDYTEDDRYSDCLEAIAESYMSEQDIQGAEEFYRAALEYKVQKYGTDHLAVAFAINNMGKVAYFQKRYAEGERYAKEYIRVCAAILGPKHPHVACGWQNVATICHVQEKFPQAEHAYKLAIGICSENLGESHPTTVRLKRNYANLLHTMNKLADAQGMDPFAQGIISGNWRAIDVPVEQTLMERDLDAI